MIPDIRDDRRSALTRFFDNFLQERNIQWVLGAGMIIVLGSTLMLVVTHWDHYTPAWKYLIMLGYTGAIYVAGQCSYHVMGLRKTGTILMALTVLLWPVMFLALHWVQRTAADQATWATEATRDAGGAAWLTWRFTRSDNQLVNLALWGVTVA